MVTESPLTMLSDMGVRSVIGSGGDGFGGEELEKELGLLRREQRRQEAMDRERELNVYRSGSAPPTVEGSLTALGGILGREVASGMPDFSTAKNGYGFSTEEELLSNPAYVSYYYSHVNLNPRLPPPVLSKEDWRSTQRLQAGSSVVGGIEDRRKINCREEGDGRSLFLKQPVFGQLEEHAAELAKAPGSGEWLDKGDGLIGLSIGRQKSFADVVQDELVCKSPISAHQSHPATRNAFVNGLESSSSATTQFPLHKESALLNGQQFGAYPQSKNGPEKVSVPLTHSFASVVGSSLRRSTTPDAQLVARAPSPCLPHGGPRTRASDEKANDSSSVGAASSSTLESNDLIAALSGFNLSDIGTAADDNFTQPKLQQRFDDRHNTLFSSQSGQNNVKAHNILKSSDPEYPSMQSISKSTKFSYPDSYNSSGGQAELINSGSGLNGLIESQRSYVPSGNSYLQAPSPYISTAGSSSPHYQNLENANGAFASSGLNAYSENLTLPTTLLNHVGSGNLPPLFEGAVAASAVASGMESRALGGGLFASPNLAGPADLQTLSRIGNQTAAAALQTSLNDPLYVQYLKAAEYTAQIAANCCDPSLERGYMGNSYADLLGIPKAYVESLLQQENQYNMPFLSKSGRLNHSYYGNPAFGLGNLYPGSPLASSIASPVGHGSPLNLSERNMRFSSNLRNLSGSVLGSWHSDPTGNIDERFPSSLLDEFKSNKTRCFELAEIAGHVVEFSADQYGSRFIQQKLETATTDEKNMVFDEIVPHALSLMTDVFGNYVVQKFFDHGSVAQRRELANQLNGHVLALSLQMYGCRVIQKAIEVVDLDQKIQMVSELDGHVLRCVRDQNGNHVIQKCIECVPEDAIQFIISTFYGQVVTLSTHPYGCRVIQRVLEHCDDPNTQQIVMEEILQSVCMLAQDQYGNYVVQHVLEHGKPHERSVIIKKLTGQIVQMSQQKFASNVVEKCLTFGNLEERQLLVNEMLGSTDENEPLQAMMKDQFANYVVQKVLETCDDQQRELILSRIKVHLNALKKYTYGKHIVARVEKLVAAGERRIGVQSSSSSYPSYMTQG
ncbi:hypothetical protein C4D60_Mb10t04580 [Musa balbisiana]|uniref:PUM-HD domain-containing protein n=1 Tax=Musa balbisiana TaxID=52838 RepID=A0A4V6T466_MUSBA|nr:hypothetical protein C4D60_Mb10t04580 [Musa balbisiana]